MKMQRLLSLRNPVVRDHRVLGQHLLPGLAYVDLLFQVFAKQGHDYRTLELRNVAIFRPLLVPEDYQILLDIQCVERAPRQWRIEVSGQPSATGRV